ncbi:MlaD family protein [Segniliparus rugosus]|uniref:Virulence factor Mce family protein n=1 Tax=Segniliparus rugosus (strain ATCC BAA-974 / DSM 45345 / CCUG 50838 / CIP 108380 / JCM 13579 / CDC 945) TaxID=679197 RepID=E5XTR0_SEGRC|nr:MlaD family protein [Segniliparus rugosus]EFV12263.1 virulence factor Mce family protein [Segniliparus rugosus ATCC BAA-974]
MKLFKKPATAALDEGAAIKRHRWIGVTSIIVVVSLLVATAWIFLSPFGGRSYTAHMTTSGGIRPGDDVRVAGISVGKITSVRLDRTEVRMAFTVTSSVFVGSDTSLEIKLLTPLGGRYVAVHPEGDTPLGEKTIPSSRVVLPFTLPDIIRAAEPIVKKVDGQVIHDTFSEIAKSTNQYPDSLRNVLQATNTMTNAMTRVENDYKKVVAIAQEYSSVLIANRHQLQTLLERAVIILRLTQSKGTELLYLISQGSDLLRTLKRLVVFYGDTLEPVVNSIDDLFDITYAHVDRVGQALDGIGQLLRIVMPMLHGEGIFLNDKNQIMDENHVEPRPDICVPNIFRQC